MSAAELRPCDPRPLSVLRDLRLEGDETRAKMTAIRLESTRSKNQKLKSSQRQTHEGWGEQEELGWR